MLKPVTKTVMQEQTYNEVHYVDETRTRQERCIVNKPVVETRYVEERHVVRKPITEFDDPDWSAKFHLWRMDWDESSIKLYVDDLLLNEIDVTKTFNKDKEGKNPFRQPHYMILNLAIGGTNGGDPSKTKFPAKFEVDYVRVYKKQR